MVSRSESLHGGFVAAARAAALLVCAVATGAWADDVRPGSFLVAQPHLHDRNFVHSVVLVIQHGPAGTSGVIVNRRSPMRIAQVMPQFQDRVSPDDALYFGGPVNRQQAVMLLRSPDPVPGALHVFGDVHFSASGRLLEEWIGRNDGDTVLRIYAGIAGWAPGQLAAELARGDWRVVDGDSASIFDRPPEHLWKDLTEPARGRPWVRLAEPLGRSAG